MNSDLAKKVLQSIDAGLVSGLGEPIPGHMCLEAAVCYALGEPHRDSPDCVARSVRELVIRLNDARWSSRQARARGLRRLGIAQLGTAGVLDEGEFVRRVVTLVGAKYVPIALRAAAADHPRQEHRKALEEAAQRCRRQPTLDEIGEARDAAFFADVPSAYLAARSAFNAAFDADRAARYASVAGSAARAAVYAAAAAALSTSSGAAGSDEMLREFAEDVVQILISMGAPGCQFLYLTENKP